MTYILDKILVNFLAKSGHPTAGGAEVNTIVYIVKGSGQSLFGLKDGEEQQTVRQLASG